MKIRVRTIKVLIIVAVVAFQALASQYQIYYVNILALLLAFFTSLYLHEKFFPLFTVSIGLFLMASLQEMYDVSYIKLPITIYLHLAARLMFAVAVIAELFKAKNYE